MIELGAAGYWEASLRDSISKNPIPHAKEICAFVNGKWWLVPTTVFRIVVHGRAMVTEHSSAVLSEVQCDDMEFAAMMMEDIQSKAIRPL